MGHEIDPGDPINGGCDTCIAYVPDTLTMYLLERGPGGDFDFEGELERVLPGSNDWHGSIFAPGEWEYQVELTLCSAAGNDAELNVVGLDLQNIEGFHCNFPLIHDWIQITTTFEVLIG